MKQISLYFMAYSQGKFLGNMLTMTSKTYYNRASQMPKNLQGWFGYEIGSRKEDKIPFIVSHEFPVPGCIQIEPDIKRIKILQQAKDGSGTSWEKFFEDDVKNWKLYDAALYTVPQKDLENWRITQNHLISISCKLQLSINYKLAKRYFDVYWQVHRHLFSN